MVKQTLSLVFCFSVFHSPSAYADESVPSIEFLEYLADLETNDDKWTVLLSMKEIENNQAIESNKEKGNE